MRKPNFLIIGAKKAGSTLLYEMLGQHAEVWFPEEKEPDYFIEPDWEQPERWNAYLSLFSTAPPEARWIGEASVGYTTTPHNGDTPQRIHERLGRPKLVYILRDPVKRAISNFEHSFLHGFYEPDITLARAIESDPILIDTSRYAMQLDRYTEVFGEDSVHVVVFEELLREPRLVLETVAKYLELSPDHPWQNELPTVNSGRQNAVSVQVDRWLGAGLLRRLTRRIPNGLKERLRAGIPAPDRDLPEVTQDDVARLTASLAADVSRLRERLGPRIEVWPTLERLG